MTSPTEQERTYYEVLGVDAEADQATLRVAYRKLMRQYHPDVAGPESQDMAAEIAHAWSVLGDETKRKEYDERLAKGEAEPEGEPDYADFEDSWGEQGDWEEPVDEEVVEETEEELGEDEVVVEDDQPASDHLFEWMQRGEGREEHFSYPRARLPVFGSLGVAAVLAVAIISFLASSDTTLGSQQRLLIVAVAVVVGTVLGALLVAKKAGTFLLGFAILATAVAVTELAVPEPIKYYVRLAYPALAALSLAAYVFQVLQRQKEADEIIKIKTLRQNNTFGSLPGTIDADLLNRDCQPLYSATGLRLLRNPQPGALFSHIAVCGSRVALLRAVVADGGVYRWSGPTLLRDDPTTGIPQEVTSGAYAQYVSRMEGALGKGAEVMAWLVIYPRDKGNINARPDPGLPVVMAARDAIDAAGSFLTDDDNDLGLVDQERVIKVSEAMFTEP